VPLLIYCEFTRQQLSQFAHNYAKLQTQ